MKWQALQERRQAQVPVSQVCAKYDVRPNQLYQWEQTAERALPNAGKGWAGAHQAVCIDVARLDNDLQD